MCIGMHPPLWALFFVHLFFKIWFFVSSHPFLTANPTPLKFLTANPTPFTPHDYIPRGAVRTLSQVNSGSIIIITIKMIVRIIITIQMIVRIIITIKMIVRMIKITVVVVYNIVRMIIITVVVVYNIVRMIIITVVVVVPRRAVCTL